MTMIALLCGFFFFGYLLLRERWQAIGFLVIGAGFQTLSYLVPPPGAPGDPATDYATFLLVCIASGLGYAAWHSSRKWLDEGLFTKQRIGVFLGLAANGLLAAFILWQTGVISLPA